MRPFMTIWQFIAVACVLTGAGICALIALFVVARLYVWPV